MRKCLLELRALVHSLLKHALHTEINALSSFLLSPFCFLPLYDACAVIFLPPAGSEVAKTKDMEREPKLEFMDWLSESECMLRHGIGVSCIGKLLDRPVSSAALGFV